MTFHPPGSMDSYVEWDPTMWNGTLLCGMGPLSIILKPY